MPTFAELYSSLNKEIFAALAGRQLEQGADGLTVALAYAEQGKPAFTLAYLLQIELSEAEKREIFALSYERRAILSEEKADALDRQFHRPFPLIKLAAQKDRLVAQQVRQGRRVRRDAGTNKILRVN